MTEILTGDFLKMSLQDIADLLLDSISDDKKCSGARCYGTDDDDGHVYKLTIAMEMDR